MNPNSIRFSLLASLALVQIHCGSAPIPTREPRAEPESTAPPIQAEGDAGDVPIAATQTPPAQPRAATDHGFAFGTYVQTHVAFDECDSPDMCEVEVDDLLTISDGNDGALEITIEVTQDNGHSCNYSGILAQLEPGQWGWSDETQTCRIGLSLENHVLELTSDGCRETYCGARAQLQGSFPLAGHTATTNAN